MIPADHARIAELLGDPSLSCRAIARETGYSDWTIPLGRGPARGALSASWMARLRQYRRCNRTRYLERRALGASSRTMSLCTRKPNSHVYRKVQP